MFTSGDGTEAPKVAVVNEEVILQSELLFTYEELAAQFAGRLTTAQQQLA